jgi:hypothetical protein
MQCKVTMQRPDGSRARHVGYYPNPGMAMDVVQALHPDCAVNVAVATGPTSPAARSCEALGVCQSITKACPAYTMCAREHGKFYFAPGAIEGGSIDLRMDADAGWVLDMRWHDWVAGLAIVIIVGAIAGMAA